MVSVDDVVKRLEAHSRPDQIEGMARYGMDAQRRMGVSVPDLRKIARDIGKDHDLAQQLWQTGIPEAMIVAALVDSPDLVTEEQMDAWAKDLSSWDVCDQVCMNLFDKTPHALNKIAAWSERPEEFVKRAAFALIACLAWHDKSLNDDVFISLFPLIKQAANDERNYVKKAVSWALRHIGKRNCALNRAALELALEIEGMNIKAARWIASDVLRELRSDAVQKRLQP